MTESDLPDEAAAFLRETLGEKWSEDWAVEPLFGDASVRAYYRIRRPDGSTMMLTWYPAEVRAQLGRVLRAYEAVSPHAPVPAVLHSGAATTLQRDVGDRTLYDVLHDDREEGIRLYRAAVDALIGFQKAAPHPEINPPFTAQFFFDELEMAREYYVEKLKGLDGAPLVPLLRKIAEKVASHPYVICHRDYHGQNLHVFNGELFLIDYQDLRMGPDTYDLASLLRDRGVARVLGRETELELVDYYATHTGKSARATHTGKSARATGKSACVTRYFETLLQRSIKILGTFARQAIVRGRTHYLEFVPPALESIGRCLEELPEFQGTAIGELLQ